MGPDGPALPGAPRSPAGGRASRAAARVGRARSSGRQPLSTASPSCGEDAPTTGRPHPGAEAMFLGAVSLLGLVGLLHRDCPGSSPSGLGAVLSRPLEARKRAGRHESARRVVVRRMIRPPSKGCQTSGLGAVSASRSPVRMTMVGRVARPSGTFFRDDGRRRRDPSGLRTDTPGGIAELPCSAVGRCYPLRAFGAGNARGSPRGSSETDPRGARETPGAADLFETLAAPTPVVQADWATPSSTVILKPQDLIERMDAKQVWRAALGELQVSLSPANYETWLRDTALVDVDDQRFRIAVPNGFAKDWLETRYRSLISQTLARIVGYSVQVEFVVGTTPERRGGGEPTGERTDTAEPASPRPADRRRSGSNPAGSAARAGRPTSTRATRSATSSSARPTAWPTPPACRSRSARATPTTRCSCTAASASARPT